MFLKESHSRASGECRTGAPRPCARPVVVTVTIIAVIIAPTRLAGIKLDILVVYISGEAGYVGVSIANRNSIGRGRCDSPCCPRSCARSYCTNVE